MNCITLVGRAGRDPEARYFESGTMVANVSLAVNGRGRDAETVWFPLEIWGKTAQVAVDYVRKGSLIGVTGSVKMQKWTDRTTGEERSKMVVAVDRLDLLGSKKDSEDSFAGVPSDPAAARPQQPAPAAQHPAYAAAGHQPQWQAAAPVWNSGPVSNEEPPF